MRDNLAHSLDLIRRSLDRLRFLARRNGDASAHWLLKKETSHLLRVAFALWWRVRRPDYIGTMPLCPLCGLPSRGGRAHETCTEYANARRDRGVPLDKQHGIE